jgi:hypothetical protein
VPAGAGSRCRSRSPISRTTTAGRSRSAEGGSSAPALRRDPRPASAAGRVLKISGMLRGSVSASVRILWLFVRYNLSRSLAAPRPPTSPRALSATRTGTVPDRMRTEAALAISQSFVVGVLLIYVQRRMQGIVPRAAVTVSVRAGGPPVTRAPRRDLRGAAGELTLGMRSARLEVVEILSSGGASTML